MTDEIRAPEESRQGTSESNSQTAPVAQAPIATETVTVNIMGYSQKLTCRLGEAAQFEEAARRVEASLFELRKNIPNFPMERIAILVALDICHELLLKELKIEEISNIVKTRSDKIRELLAKIEVAY